MEEIQPIAMPGTHQSFIKFFNRQSVDPKAKILDVGAGHGAFTKKLYDKGFEIQACDLDPTIFHFTKVECKQVDITKSLPYEDNSFDIVMAIEVLEHIIDHERFFSEVSRILKPGGRFFASTPNMLSLKSRSQYLFKGFFHSFGPLDMTNFNGMQHVTSRTLDQYNYIAVKNGFHPAIYDIDKKQRTSQWLLLLVYPIIFLNRILNKTSPIHNRRKLLIGRIIFLSFKNKK
ncbi:MAG: methyltransferase domain-containing protein [Candidatus Cyclobacteriaceae bacterium M2_1C_046]